MKTLLFSLLSLTLMLSAELQASNILIYKVTESSTYNTYGEDSPNTPSAKGYVYVGTYTDSYYLIIDLDALPDEYSKGAYHQFRIYSDTYPWPAIDKNGTNVTSKKTMLLPDLTAKNGLIINGGWGLLDSYQPLKLANNYLWNKQQGNNYGNEEDWDEDTTNDVFTSTFSSAHLTGTGTPLVLSPTLTIPNVARTLTGKEVSSNYYEDTLGWVEDGIQTFPPFTDFTRTVTTTTWTLDANLTKLANTLPVMSTSDVQPEIDPEMQAAGTMSNGVQRVHDLLYSQGYRVSAGFPGSDGSGS